MRDMSKVIQGLLQSDPKYYDTKEAMVRLWVHECLRVFHDRLVSEDDRDKLIDIINTKLSIFETSWKRLFKESKKLPMFADFLEEEAPAVIGDLKELKDDEEERAPYVEVSQKKAKVKKFMEDKQKAYDLDPDSDGQDLVLFDQAIAHVIRVYRIITQPRGSALLIGVGGSGRQSLTRLAAFIAGMKCKQIKPTKSYLLPDFREDLKQLYRQTGVKQEKTVFLLSDTQITDEAFLEDVNNILNSGEVPKLFPQDELTPLLEELREEATAKQRPTTQDALYLWLIERVRTNLHVVLAMSPIGADFRNRVRMFPALVNCTTIDWYSDWQPAALKDVAFRFINETECGGKKNKEALAQVFTAVHTSVIETSTVMQKELNRTNYVTPTKYLDLVKSFHSLLNEKRMGLGATIDKQLNGIRKLDEGSGQVKAMKVQLEEKYRKLKLQQQTCDKLMLEIGQKKRSESEQKKLVEVDTVRLEDEEKSCKEEARSAQEELDKASTTCP
jgi:dynein heavy chain